MKKRIWYSLVVCTACAAANGSAIAAESADPADKPLVIENLHAVKMFPPISEREAWEGIQKDPKIKKFRNKIIAEAEKLLGTEIRELPATLYMDYIRNGNRSRYEKIYLERRDRLKTLFFAEAFEYKGRFTDRMINEIWAILSEPTWCLPAHAGGGRYLDERDDPKRDDPLCYFGYEVVDIFSAETSAYLSCIYHLAHHELKTVSPGLLNRMRDVILDRSVRTFDKYRNHFWIGITGNWNPWICANLICTANNMFQDNPEALTKFVGQILQPSMNSYMQKFPADGCCDEGPAYWGQSVGYAIVYYEFLYRQSDGKLSLYDSPKFRKMSEYKADMIIGEHYVVNFADCGAYYSGKGGPRVGFYSLFAERVGSRKLQAYCMRTASRSERSITTIIWTLSDLFMLKTGETAERGDFDVWYDKCLVLVVKSGRMHFAAKAGNNHENHNHNDIGQFILSADGIPFIADLGATEYTRDTFSEKRYDIPFYNSLYHNVPVFDGKGQAAGPQYKSQNVVYEKKDQIYRFSMELAGTYPEELGILSCKRLLELDLKAKKLTVTDEWRTRKPCVFSITLFTTADPKKGPYAIKTTFPLNTEKFEITDSKQKQNWEKLWKSNLASSKVLSGKNVMEFSLKRTEK